jgi:hypothetical protein
MAQQAEQAQKTGECAYCGALGPITGDHVPPRSFYPTLPPDNLITVPSCKECNGGRNTEDDYVRLVLTTTEGASGNASRNELIPKIKLFVEHQRAKNVLRGFYESLGTGYLPNDAGVYVQREHFVVEGARLDAFARRVVKALFYREKGHRLPDKCAINAINYRRIDEVIERTGDPEFWGFILNELIENSPRQTWGDVFGYWWLQSPKDPDATWWLLEFYGTAQYLCSTF